MGLFSATLKIASFIQYVQFWKAGRRGELNVGFVRLYEKWAVAYRAFLRHRYRRLSKGGGAWKDNATNTPILRVTDTLYDALTPVFKGLPGQYQKFVPGGVQVGIKGGKHPDAIITVGRLAAIHNVGEGRMPKRQIIVRPDGKTSQAITKELRIFSNKVIDDTAEK